ncbi:GNAT family N-acetyltransferase [Rhizobium oryzicola]|uniref:Aminoglycoside N(6')-acetyltransferase type 1 n=1 Tax=Rhizobium oryzicola TaxID=1232668 RepID=A0ABT8SVJ2_9HYPH|nr:GNAT family N-acetyltransferase [Rhizobium oryzicola]MDO1582169.1 GNAT family N-acetyltransferase [Rhizobium oryzicola]
MNAEDVEEWCRMRNGLWGRLDIGAHKAEIVAMLCNPRHRAYLATGGDRQSQGFAEVSIRDYANGCTRTPVPFLEGIWVEPKERRSGVGAALLAQIMAELRSEGYDELCSDAEIDNLISHQAHAAWGFQETKRVVFFRRALSN